MSSDCLPLFLVMLAINVWDFYYRRMFYVKLTRKIYHGTNPLAEVVRACRIPKRYIKLQYHNLLDEPLQEPKSST